MKSYVYILESANRLYKIGHSFDPEMRLAAVQQNSPVAVRLVAMWEGTRADEDRLHKGFSASNSHREWFLPTADVCRFVGAKFGLGVESVADFELPNFNGETRAEAKIRRMRETVARRSRKALATAATPSSTSTTPEAEQVTP